MSVVVNAQGFTAWKILDPLPRGSCGTTNCYDESIYASDDHGSHLVDSTQGDNGALLSNVALSGNELTWTHSGTLRNATLG